MTTTASIASHPNHKHGLDTLAGYSIVETSWADGARDIDRIEVARVDDPCAYIDALALLYTARDRVALLDDGRHHYAMVDNIYECGCRSHAINSTTVGL